MTVEHILRIASVTGDNKETIIRRFDKVVLGSWGPFRGESFGDMTVELIAP
jgi:hypothetical protein